MTEHAHYLLDAGFIVLVPDFRGHGSSGGDITTYGIREAGDVHAWAEWLFRERGIQRLYGMGESLGAAILLQSLPREPRFRAVVAECSFSTFEEVANYRLEHASHLGLPFTWPVVRTAFVYGRLRYGIDLRQASPAAAIRSVHTPILLIHGTLDVNIPPEHSRELHAANPAATQLWEVAGAGHVAAVSVQPSRFVRTVTDWFRYH
jgi:dipeptidyl aminopeptidase/acylaminoacyl peptidase